MRVITGTAKGTTLVSADHKTHPLSDRAKSALFSIIQAKILNAAVLDLYAGSGALGIECLSRGATSASFIDISKNAIESVQTNLVKTHFLDKAYVLQIDALEYVKKYVYDRYDIIFICPPYDMISFHVVKLAPMLLNPEGILIFEHNKRDIFHELETIKKIDERVYGIVKFEIYQKV